MGGYELCDYTLSTAVRRALNRYVGRGLTLAILLAASVGEAATYRWVDEQGKVHYGDRIPPQYVGQGHSELNGQGRVIRRVDRAPSSTEARQRREQEHAQHETEEQEARVRQRRDNALLATYSSAREIELAKSRALDQEQAMLDSLLVMRKNSGSKAEIDEMIRQRQKSMDATRAKYDADLARYHELTGSR
jgi:hypothetical protein